MPSPVAELLRDLARVFGELNVRWYLFGAQAALLYGASRLTADVDVTVLLPTGVDTQTLASSVIAPSRGTLLHRL